MTGMEAFFTRDRANEGIQVPLYLPDGTLSEHWLRIRGVDSDAFRLAEADSRRDAMRVAMIDNVEERAAAIAEAKLVLIASLVMSWSFETPCTKEEVVAFLKQAPQVSDAIDQVASKRTFFFGKKSSSSPSTQKPSSASTKGRKVRSRPSARV